MDEIIAILNELQPEIDEGNCDGLLQNHLLDSLAMIALVGELEDAFDITIPTVAITRENFDSADAILALVNRLREEDQ